MALRKPKLDPYSLRCDACFKLGKLLVFVSQKDLEKHMKEHWK